MCRFAATLTAVLALLHTLQARDLLQVDDATWPPEWDIYKAYVNARLETWDQAADVASRPCGSLGAKPCPGKSTCNVGGPAGGPTAQLVVNKLGRCQMPGNECGLQGEPPCNPDSPWLTNIGMFSDVMHVNWAFDMGADGCVVSAFYHSIRFVLDKASGVCVPCGSPGEPACAKNDHDPAPPCASNIRTDPGTASVLSGAVCKAVASTCGTLGGPTAESSPACPKGPTPFTDINADGCEDHLTRSGTNCVPCKPSTATEFMTVLGGHTCDPTNVAYADCGDNEQAPCYTAPGRKFGCLGGTHQKIVNFTNSQTDLTETCVYASCGTPGADTPLCGPMSEATNLNFFNKIEPEYDPLNTGCYPGYNKRNNACWPCGNTFEDLVGGAGQDPLNAFKGVKDAFLQQTLYPSYWDGILETKLWRTRCDNIGCGLQTWSLLTNSPYNATLGRSQPFMLNPDLSICAADPGWLDRGASPFYLHNYFTNTDLGLDWAVGLGAPPLPGNDSVSTGSSPPNFGSTYKTPGSAAVSSSLAYSVLALVFGALASTLLA